MSSGRRRTTRRHATSDDHARAEQRIDDPATGQGGLRRGQMARSNFTQVSNALCRDERLSHNAKGVWINIASNKETYPVTLDRLVETGADGRHAVRSGLDELIRYGYVTRRARVRLPNGHLGPYEYEITDQPEPPLAVVPDPVADLEPGSEIRTQDPALTAPYTGRSTPRSAYPTLASPTQENRTTQKNKRKNTKQTDSSAASADHAVMPTTDGAALLRGLNLRHPVTQQVLRQHAAHVDALLGTWPSEELAVYLEAECAGPGIRNLMGRLVIAIREAPDRPTIASAAAATRRRECGTCDEDTPGWKTETIDDGLGGKDVVRPCPNCRTPSAPPPC